MGWDLAGMGNYSAAVAVAAVTIKCEGSSFEEKNPAGVLQKITFEGVVRRSMLLRAC